MGLSDVWGKVKAVGSAARSAWSGGVMGRPVSEQGKRATPENGMRYLYRTLWVDPDVRQSILDIREMDRLDGRVKRIHARLARDTVKGGLVLTQSVPNKKIRREWESFVTRLQLNRVEKLKSDARGLAMEGNLPLQWVLDEALQVVAGIRMPSETILPNVDDSGRFKTATEAYFQIDVMTGGKIAVFPLWQLFLCRFDPDSFDDMGAMGRPFLDANREVWKKLRMTEEDLVIRRRTRAPARWAHVLEGATVEELDAYQRRVEGKMGDITTDFYMNKKGGVESVQGDAALSEIGDVVHLLDTFFAGGPLPKGMMGYTDGMARDILEDLKRDYYEEVDVFQDTLAFGYEAGFRLHLLLKGMAPGVEEFTISFAERRTETPNQTTDRMLKWQAMGLPRNLIFEEMGFNAETIRDRLAFEKKTYDPYPEGAGSIAKPAPGQVKVTPGNAPKGESATSVPNAAAKPNRLGEHWAEDGRDSTRVYVSELFKALGESGMLKPAAPQPVHFHMHEGDKPVSAVTLTADLKLPDNLPGIVVQVAAPSVQVDNHVATPSVNNIVPVPAVSVAAPVVSVAAPNVTVENSLTSPPRTTETTHEYNLKGELVRSVQVDQ